jgi:hypothetical protein
MSRQPGFYWAKHPGENKEEVVECIGGYLYRTTMSATYEETQFSWVDDEPITPKKAPVKLVDRSYYVVHHPEDVNFKLVVQYEHDYFWRGEREKMRPSVCTIISGPFTIEELCKLRPV